MKQIKRQVVLLECAPQDPTGYAINLLKGHALADPSIDEHWTITCKKFRVADFSYGDDDGLRSRKFSEVINVISKLNPTVVGFSVFVWNVEIITKLTKMLKLVLPHCALLWGGKLVENHWNVLANQCKEVDCFCISEGELVLNDFLLNFDEYYRHRIPIAGAVIRNQNELIKGPSISNIPVLSSKHNPYLLNYIKADQTSTAFIETMRGCRFSCSFCDWGGKNYRHFDEQIAASVIKKCLDEKFQVIAFLDSIFGDKPSRQEYFLQYLVENYNGFSKFAFEIYLEMISEKSSKLLAELFEFGAIGKIEIGIQTTNKNTLRKSNRPQNLVSFTKKYWKLIGLNPDIRDVIQVDLIVGLPEETVESFSESLNLIFSLDPGIISIFPLDVFPGSELWNKRKELGLVSLEEPPYSLVSTPSMDFSTLETLVNIAWTLEDLRLVMRRSLFLLHRTAPGGIFDIVRGFVEARGSVRTALHEVKDTFLLVKDFVEYMDLEYGFPNNEIRITFLQQVLFEISPTLMMENLWDEFSFLWEDHKKNSSSNCSDPNLELILFDKIPKYEFSDSGIGLTNAEPNDAFGVIIEQSETGCTRRIVPRKIFGRVLDIFSSGRVLSSIGFDPSIQNLRSVTL